VVAPIAKAPTSAKNAANGLAASCPPPRSASNSQSRELSASAMKPSMLVAV
jgi:hypothetical protein